MFTPGKWHYKNMGFTITIGNYSTRHGYLEHDVTVCTINGNSMVNLANARLIAAAPEMFEALINLCQDNTRDNVNRALRVLDTVRGKTDEQEHYRQVGLGNKKHCDVKNKIGYLFEDCPECNKGV
jgi:hypothetical protein